MLVSVIIPTWNEADRIGELVQYLRRCSAGHLKTEIIVADGFSSDQTVLHAKQSGAITVEAPRGRANQMNLGASAAQGEILFFLHADTLPPESFLRDLDTATKEGYSAGCYRLSFDYDHWFLRFNSWFTRFHFTPFRFGDQGLFVSREVFERVGGFNQNLLVLEDQEMVKRISGVAKFKILDTAVVTSARKYVSNGIFRLQFLFFLIYVLYKLGMAQQRLIRIYRRFIHDERDGFPLAGEKRIRC